MTTPDQTLCPIPHMGYCIYEKCPYWDQDRQECDADCLKNQESSPEQSYDGPCTIHWTEDND
ncbi:MAG: hypothetical protein ACOZF2_16735 [Thermodesulfobacteriota bacterium]